MNYGLCNSICDLLILVVSSTNQILQLLFTSQLLSLFLHYSTIGSAHNIYKYIMLLINQSKCTNQAIIT